MSNNIPCKGYRLVPYGISLSGTMPCEHRENGRLCPDADAEKIAKREAGYIARKEPEYVKVQR